MSSWDGIFIFHVRYMYLIIVIANIYYMKNMMREANGSVNSILKVIREILFIVAIVVLFFIS